MPISTTPVREYRYKRNITAVPRGKDSSIPANAEIRYPRAAGNRTPNTNPYNLVLINRVPLGYLIRLS